MLDLQGEIKKIFDEEFSTNLNVGYAVGVYYNEIADFFCSGLSSVENNKEITNKTKFHIASLTKHFTALIFRAIEKEGLINENDLLSSYFPNENDGFEKIQLKHLLDHRSGIRDQWELAEYAGWKKHDLITNEDIIDLYKRQKSLNFLPNEYYLYCNTGYTLIALILEKVTGESIRGLFKRCIAWPLNLNSTGYYKYDDVVLDIATPYVIDKFSSDSCSISAPYFDVIGSTSMYSSIDDFILFEKKFHQNASDFNTENSEYSRNSLNNKDFYHDGLLNYSLSTLNVQMHGGWDYGYRSYLLRLINLKTSVVIFSNYGISNLSYYALRIASLLHKDIINIPTVKLLVEKNEASKQNQSNIKDGFYLNDETNIVFNIRHDDQNNIFWEDTKILNIKNNTYVIENSLNEILVLNSYTFRLRILDTNLTFKFIETGNIDMDSSYSGKYYSEELDVIYDVKAIDGQLIILGSRFTKYSFIQINDIYFKSKNFTLKFLKSDAKVAGFQISNLRAWNMYFEKLKT